MKNKIGELLVQIIPVMIGVFLGLWVANWSEGNKKEERVQALMENIKTEIITNQGILNNVIAYHEMLRDSSRHYSSDAATALQARFFKGTRLSRLMSSAYDTGIQTGVLNDLSLSQIQGLSRLYTFQEDYNDFCNMLMTNLLEKDFSGKEEDMKRIARFLSITMTDVVIQEKDLLHSYESALSQL